MERLGAGPGLWRRPFHRATLSGHPQRGPSRPAASAVARKPGKTSGQTPKAYLADSRLLHGLLDLPTHGDLIGHPKVGASREGFAMGEVLARLGAHPGQCFFWATHGGAELDLLVVRGVRRFGFEFKHAAAPRLTASMRVALRDLKPERLDVVYVGSETFVLSDDVRALGLDRLLRDLDPLDAEDA